MATNMKASTLVATAAGGLGCIAVPFGAAFMGIAILIIGGIGFLLLPIVIIFMFFNGLSFSGLGDIGNPGSDLTATEQKCQDAENAQLQSDPNGSSDRASTIITGDGLGALELSPSNGFDDPGGAPCTVPEDLYKTIEKSGGACDVIGPVIIASQIEYESGFDAKFVGPNGAKGISQVPLEDFKRIEGSDADPFDPKKSIDAQGKYLCELSGQVQDLLDKNEATGNKLDLTLTAYDIGIDAVREAKGVPATNDSQSYIIGVRSWFAPMEGIGPVPRKLASVPALHDDNGANQGADQTQ